MVYDAVRAIVFPGQTADLNGSNVTSQKFSGAAVAIPGADSTIKEQNISDAGTLQGIVTNAVIVESGENSRFTRICGH